MKHFRRILCMVDPLAKQQVALERAIALAEQSNASLKVVDVVDTTRGWLGLMLRSHAELLEQERRGQLEKLARQHSRPGIQVETQLLHGRPSLALVGEAIRGQFDLVVKDARGTSSHRTLLVGSIDMRLLRNCPCPVWLQMPGKQHENERILAAIDPLADDAAHKSLNRTILELASGLAKQSRAELHVVAAWNTPGEELLATRIPEDRLRQYVEKAQRLAKQGLDHSLRHRQVQLQPERLHFEKGEPATVILNAAQNVQADLLVMASVSHNQSSLLIGNTADTVLRQVNCSVLAVKPEGFVSPLETQPKAE